MPYAIIDRNSFAENNGTYPERRVNNMVDNGLIYFARKGDGETLSDKICM